jgi:CHAT domain-containing protein
MDLYSRVLEVRVRKLGPGHPDVLTVRNNIAAVHHRLGRFAEARDGFLKLLLEIRRTEGPDSPAAAAVLGNLAAATGDAGDLAGARELMERVLESQERLTGRDSPKAVLGRINKGQAMWLAGERREGEYVLRGALETAVRLWGADHQLAALAASVIGKLASLEGRRGEAIFFLKLSVAAAQRTRGTLAEAGEGLERSFMSTVDIRYHILFDELMKAGRREEALEVLGLLKEDEIRGLESAAGPAREPGPTGTAAGDAAGGGAPGLEPAEGGGSLFAGTPEEAAWRAFEGAASALAASGAEEEEGAASGGAGDAFQAALTRLPELLSAGTGTAPAAAGKLRAVRERLAGTGAALVYAVSVEETLYLVMVTPDGLVTRETAAPRRVVFRLAMEFRELVRDRGRDPRPAGKRLYDMVVGPVAGDLEKAGARTVMLSLDGALRYVPAAAFWDGEGWLAERYPTAIFSGSTLDRMRDGGTGDKAGRPATAEAMGVTRAWPGFPELPGVAREIRAIVGSPDGPGIISGNGFLDADFDRGTFAGGLASGAQVVHVASHFALDSESLERTSLLLGDGTRLSLAEMRSSPDFDFRGLDLLALSACDTGSGARKGEDGREVESLGEVFLREGAQAVLATLLPVDDASATDLMREFYRLRYVEGMDKAGALRGAQLAMIRDGAGVPEPSPERGTLLSVLDGTASADGAPPWNGRGRSHPCFWAPFVVMGDWR